MDLRKVIIIWGWGKGGAESRLKILLESQKRHAVYNVQNMLMS